MSDWKLLDFMFMFLIISLTLLHFSVFHPSLCFSLLFPHGSYWGFFFCPFFGRLHRSRWNSQPLTPVTESRMSSSSSKHNITGANGNTYTHIHAYIWSEERVNMRLFSLETCNMLQVKLPFCNCSYNEQQCCCNNLSYLGLWIFGFIDVDF